MPSTTAESRLVHRHLPQPREFRFGPRLLPDGTCFRIWAPLAESFDLVLKGEAAPRRMQRNGQWFELDVAGVGPGALYNFAMADGTRYPDPASRFQPYDARSWSEVIDPAAFPWSDGEWLGRPWHEAVIYELHVGTFTPQGTFRAAIEKLDHLAELGVTAIELMPIADFPGRWNWGYDGVLLFAPDASYGRPDDLRALVDAAHVRGMMVLLDVVYNHLGPEGNYLEEYSNARSRKHDTPWGPQLDFDDVGAHAVRRYVAENALYWLTDFHFDGLRLDSIHSIKDESETHFLEELATTVHEATRGRHFHLIAENAENQPLWLKRAGERGQPEYFTAQWNDDIHHALHAIGTGEDNGYYADFARRPDRLARALAEGFAFQGETPSSQDHAKGGPSGFLPPVAFVSYIQNHDQVGNRPFGERIAALRPPEVTRALAALYLLAPQIPMLFMGEEWGARQAFLFFSDLSSEHAKKTRDLHRHEAKNAPPVPDGVEVPDPFAEDSFFNSRLRWEALAEGEHAACLAHYRELLDVRHREIIPRLPGTGEFSGRYQVIGKRGLDVSWRLGDGALLQLVANLGDEALHSDRPWRGRTLWLEGEASESRLGPWSLAWTLDDHAAGA